jgi:hypothetical protein
MGCTAGVRFWVEARSLSPLHSVLMGSETSPASYSVVPGAVSPELKLPGRETNCLPPSTAEIKNGGAILPLPHTPSWRGA